MKISIIIPMYNEAAIAEDCVRTLASAMAKTSIPCEILFSDDGPPTTAPPLSKKPPASLHSQAWISALSAPIKTAAKVMPSVSGCRRHRATSASSRIATSPTVRTSSPPWRTA
ncbi:MAG: glycosyltransferase [Clostridia bacterium]|nr:glycosyltransferase [Clostridia bacterium]